MKKGIVLLVLALICSFVFTACKDVKKPVNNTTPEEEEVVTYKFGFSCITMDNPYFIALEAALRDNIESQGHVLITKDATSDVELQKQQIDEFIKEKVDAVFLAPVDWTEIEPAIDRLNEAGIKIINLDTQIQAFDKVDAYVGSDNSNAGKLCGEDLLVRLPEGGKIIIVECPNRNSVNERIKGFEKTIAKEGFEVVARIDAKGDLDVAIPEVEAALQANPGVVAIMCGNDPMAIGASVAASTTATTNVIIYGIDGSPEVKKEIAKQGSMIVATVAQSTKAIGEKAAEVALQMMNGEKYEKVTYIDTYMINKENIAEHDINEWQ